MHEWMALLIHLSLLHSIFQHPHDLGLTLLIYFCTKCWTWTGPACYSTSWPFAAGGAWQWFSNLRVHQKHLGSMLKQGLLGSTLRVSDLVSTRLRPENLHFQLPRRCWDYPWRTTGLWDVISCPIGEHVLFICCLFTIGHLKPYSHHPPHPISPKTASKHNIPFNRGFPFSWDFILIK